MYSLRLTCSAEEADRVSADLWDEGTIGIRELQERDSTVLIATFDTDRQRQELLQRLAQFSPQWETLDDTDWVRHTKNAWPGRCVGDKFFIAPPWLTDPTPAGRIRLIQNPGLASGTGEHPCTQLALIALDRCVCDGSRWVDVGTGSGLLAIGAARLGAATVIGLDTDEAALASARENFELNDTNAFLAAGSAECLASVWADGVIANINATVLLAIMDELLRIVRPQGQLILTGFTGNEVGAIEALLPVTEVLALDEWRCAIVNFSAAA